MRYSVIINAYACNPYQGSEKGVGWGWVRAIARHHDVTAIVGDLHREDIERYRRENPGVADHIKFEFVKRTRWLWLEKLWKPAYLWSYRLWLRRAGRLASKLHEDRKFDIAHQITYVGFRVPGHLWKLDIPFVWGPVGGLVNVPWRLLPAMGSHGALEYGARNIINTMHKMLLPAPKKAFRRASAIIAATSGIKNEIGRWYGRESEVICEIGPPPETNDSITDRKEGEPFVLSWSGQHLPGKALPLLLRALNKLDAGIDWRLDILGDGAFNMKWRRIAKKLGIDGKCRWLGWLPRDGALGVVRDSHVFIITSMKDLTSTVLLEALSQGAPVICPNHCGFADVVDDSCGVKIPVVNRKQFEDELAGAIVKMMDDESLRGSLARGALARIGEYSWERKAEKLDNIYREAVGGMCSSESDERTEDVGVC